MTAQKKPTVEEAVLSQSLADIDRAAGRPMQAAAMDAAALEALDPMTHAHGLVTVGRGGEVALADSESYPGIIDTIREKQDMVTARASHQRPEAYQLVQHVVVTGTDIHSVGHEVVVPHPLEARLCSRQWVIDALVVPVDPEPHGCRRRLGFQLLVSGGLLRLHRDDGGDQQQDGEFVHHPVSPVAAGRS